MNYGKLAYQQAADLEKRVEHLEGKSGIAYGSCGFTDAELRELTTSFAYPVLSFDTLTATPLFVRYALAGRQSSGNFGVTLTLNGGEIAARSEAVSGEFRLEGEVNVANVAKGANRLELAALPGAGCALTEGSLTVFGNGVRERADLAVRADSAGGRVYYAERGGEEFWLRGESLRILRAAPPKSFDLVSAGGGLLLAGVDARRELTVSLISPSGRVKRRLSFGTASAAAVGYGAGHAQLAFVRAGKVFLAELFTDGESLVAGESAELALRPLPAGLAFCRGTKNSPLLLAWTGRGAGQAVVFESGVWGKSRLLRFGLTLEDAPPTPYLQTALTGDPLSTLFAVARQGEGYRVLASSLSQTLAASYVFPAWRKVSGSFSPPAGTVIEGLSAGRAEPLLTLDMEGRTITAPEGGIRGETTVAALFREGNGFYAAGNAENPLAELALAGVPLKDAEIRLNGGRILPAAFSGNAFTAPLDAPVTTGGFALAANGRVCAEFVPEEREISAATGVTDTYVRPRARLISCSPPCKYAEFPRKIYEADPALYPMDAQPLEGEPGCLLYRGGAGYGFCRETGAAPKILDASGLDAGWDAASFAIGGGNFVVQLLKRPPFAAAYAWDGQGFTQIRVADTSAFAGGAEVFCARDTPLLAVKRRKGGGYELAEYSYAVADGVLSLAPAYAESFAALEVSVAASGWRIYSDRVTRAVVVRDPGGGEAALPAKAAEAVLASGGAETDGEYLYITRPTLKILSLENGETLFGGTAGGYRQILSPRRLLFAALLDRGFKLCALNAAKNGYTELFAGSLSGQPREAYFAGDAVILRLDGEREKQAFAFSDFTARLEFAEPLSANARLRVRERRFENEIKVVIADVSGV